LKVMAHIGDMLFLEIRVEYQENDHCRTIILFCLEGADMNRKTSHSITAWLPAVVLLTALLACNISRAVPPATQVSGENVLPTAVSGPSNTVTSEPTQPEITETPTTAPIVHTLIPGEPPASFLSEITDWDSSTTATQRRVIGGENFTKNLYERPFNANTMDIYFPDLDIIRTRLLRDSQWVYVNIKLVGQNPAGGLLGDYGVEVDMNVDGRGEVLVMAAKPGATWSTDEVRVWEDSNHDVGAVHPIQSDAPVNGDGYETLVFDQGVGTDPDAAWARISPSDPNSVQIAFKRGVINDSGHFTWGAWAMSESMFNPAWFDYNDHFTIADAGSPLTELTQYYPLKAFAEVDNTCRWGVGFTPTGSEPGVCPVPPTPTPILPGTISGLVYFDWNLTGNYNNPPDFPLPSLTVRVRSGSCGSPGGVVATATTNALGNYSVSVAAGTYCVDVNPDYGGGWNEKSTPVTVTVSSGGGATAQFWYRTRID
jgi:hypothetical protein